VFIVLMTIEKRAGTIDFQGTMWQPWLPRKSSNPTFRSNAKWNFLYYSTYL